MAKVRHTQRKYIYPHLSSKWPTTYSKSVSWFWTSPFTFYPDITWAWRPPYKMFVATMRSVLLNSREYSPQLLNLVGQNCQPTGTSLVNLRYTPALTCIPFLGWVDNTPGAVSPRPYITEIRWHCLQHGTRRTHGVSFREITFLPSFPLLFPYFRLGWRLGLQFSHRDSLISKYSTKSLMRVFATKKNNELIWFVAVVSNAKRPYDHSLLFVLLIFPYPIYFSLKYASTGCLLI